MQASSNIDHRPGATTAAVPKRRLSELSDATGFIPGWQPGEGVLLENLPFGSLRHRVVVAEDGSPLYDFPHFVEPGGAALLPIAPGGKVGLVHIDRPALLKESPSGQYPEYVLGTDFGRLVWEAPRGYREAHEDVQETAVRELCEEMGLQLQQVEHVGSVTTNSAMMATPIDLFLGTVELRIGDGDSRDGIREVRFFDLKQVRELIRSGDLNCSITLSLLTHALLRGRLV
ncbi:MAG TPA: NUDIX hydrolase [Pirellulaceae bacterium]|nr:NUDIX hydrolase [Pirellulaceae bacterium]